MQTSPIDFPQLCDDYQRIEQSLHFIETNFQRQPELKEIAENVGLSEYHFQRLFTRQNAGNRYNGIGFSCQQHICPAFLHVSNETLSGTAGHHQIHAIQRVRTIILKDMQNQMAGQFNQARCRQQLPGLVLTEVIQQPMPGLPGMAANFRESFGCNGDFHGYSCQTSGASVMATSRGLAKYGALLTKMAAPARA